MLTNFKSLFFGGYLFILERESDCRAREILSGISPPVSDDQKVAQQIGISFNFFFFRDGYDRL